MKLHLEGTPEEIRERAPDLVKAMVEILAETAPEVAEVLEKAMPGPTPELHFPVLRHMQKETGAIYEQMMNEMLEKIGAVITPKEKPRAERRVKKSLEYDYTKPLAEKTEDKYEDIQRILMGYGYTKEDFEDKDGRLYGQSINQLRELVKELQSDSDS